MKKQGKSTPDQTNEEEIDSLPEKEFRVMIVKMIQNLGNRMEKIQEILNKDFLYFVYSISKILDHLYYHYSELFFR